MVYLDSFYTTIHTKQKMREGGDHHSETVSTKK